MANTFQITLPAPAQKGTLPVEEAIARRRSVRSFRPGPLKLSQISQILWAAQGLTRDRFRAAPSAGATYPLEVFVFMGSSGVEDINSGIYRYIPEDHALSMYRSGDFLNELARAALNQGFIAQAPVNILIAAVYRRTSIIYGRRAERYVPMEVGHIGQNIYLQAEALGLGTVAIGAFDDNKVVKVLDIEKDVQPLYIMPVGRLS